MSEIKTLLRHVSHYFGGRIGLIVLGFVSFPIFTRLFSVSDYGVLSLVLKTVLIFTVVSKLGLQNSVLRFYEEHAQGSGGHSLRRYYSTIIFGTAVFGTLIALFFVASLWMTPATLVSASLARLLMLGSILIAIRAVQPMLGAFLRVERRTAAYNAVEIATKAATIGTIAMLLLVWKGGVGTFLVATIVVEGVAALLLVGIFAAQGRLSVRAFDAGLFRAVVAFGTPLIAYEFASVVLDSADRILIQRYLGAESVGFYSAAHNIASYFQDLLMTPVNLALFPIYMKLWVTKGKEETSAFLSRTFDIFLLGSIGLTAAMTVVSKDAIVLLASQKYAEAQHLLPMLVAGLVLYAAHIFLNAGLLICNQTYTMARLVLYACVINLGLNILLLPRIGLQGAALATLISYAALIWMMASASFKFLPLRIEWRPLLHYLVVAGVCIGLMACFQIRNAFVQFFVKGTLTVVLYAAGVVVVDGRARKVVARMVGCWRAAEANHSPAATLESLYDTEVK
jgi:O-antigen/teichoic acid export membrane protein